MSEQQLKDKVKDMAKLSMLTNRISEVQEKNLKMYPFVFFEAVTKVVIEYDVSNNLDVAIEENQEKKEISYKFAKPETKHLHVSYYLTLDERLNGNGDKRFLAIQESVRNILWSQIKVKVFFNDKLVFESKNV